MGDRVGVGAQIGSCYKCKDCKHDNEHYCPKSINTYVCLSPFIVALAKLNINFLGRMLNIPTTFELLAVTLLASLPTNNLCSPSLMPSLRKMHVRCFAVV